MGRIGMKLKLSLTGKIANHCNGAGWVLPADVAHDIGITKKTAMQSLRSLFENETRFKVERRRGDTGVFLYRVTLRKEFYKPDFVSRADHEEITELFCEGYSLRDVGRVLEIDGEKIRRFIARNGMIRPPKTERVRNSGGFDHLINSVFR